jgi:hypothetical protein
MQTDQPDLPFCDLVSTDPSDPVPPEVPAIVSYLSSHARGQARAVTSAEIAAALGWSDDRAPRRVRNLISLYQHRFLLPVVGHGGVGYYVATDPDDLRQYDVYLYSLLKAAAVRLRAARLNFAGAGYVREGAAPHAIYTRKEGRL